MAESGFIDAHVHLWTANSKVNALDHQFSPTVGGPKSFTPQVFMDHARPCGVRRAVLIQSSSRYGTDNSYMLSVIAKQTNQFAGVAVVDVNVPDPEVELFRLRKGGVTGLRFMVPKHAGKWVESSAIQNMLRATARHNMAACVLCDPIALPAIDRVCRQLPRLTVVIDHMARIGANGAIDANDMSVLCNLSIHKCVNVKVSAFYALGGRRKPYLDLLPMIRQLRDAFGAERLMWGSDCPFQIGSGHTYSDSIELIYKHAHFLRDEEPLQLLKLTAKRVFFERTLSQ